MSDAEVQLTLAYLAAFNDPHVWTEADHLAGLKAVFAAGADAQKRKEATHE